MFEFNRHQTKIEILRNLHQNILDDIIELSKGTCVKIKYNTTSPSKKFEITLTEMLFVNELFENININRIKPMISITRMSSGDLIFEYDTYPIGRVNLRSKRYYMQILEGLYDYRSEEIDNVTTAINLIPEWIKYIKYVRRG